MGKYTLIITEKPDAANRIAMALNLNGKPKRLSENGVPYFSANNDEIIVAPALGHLYTVASVRKGEWDYPVFDYRWVPRYLAERGASRVRAWLKVISNLAENAETFIDACDYDIEGSIIGYCILKYACGNKEKTAKRMKYSTLTKEELQEAFNHLLPNLDFPQIEAGLARHEVDWLYGINLSRALTKAAKSYSGQYATLSTGRVQGPTLKFLEIREKTIRSFVPTPYWSISAKINVNGSIFEVAYEKNVIENKQEAEAIRDSCKKKEAEITKVTLKEFEQSPPVPFDLGALQSESYRLFKYTPMRTSNIAQHLYINALISYPRTSSQKLPPSIDYQKILKNLSKAASYQKLAFKLLAQPFLKPNEGKKIDPAHPAIYPTGNLPEKTLDAAERNVYDLVVKSFLAVFGEPAIKQSVNVTVNINDYYFIYSDARTLSEGWMEYYRPYVHLTDVSLPPLNEGQKVQVKKITLKDYFTKPLPRYNPRSLLLKMEKEELGTKATRASTIQTLYDRKYLQGRESMVVTELGFEVIEVLRKYCPTVVSSKMTRMLEQKMNQIYQGQVTKEAVVEEAVEILKPVTLELKEKEAVIGASLSQAIQKLRLDERTIGKCPKCQSGKLLILRSKKTGKRFVGCTNYFEHQCDAAYPLPQKGVIKTSGVCKICGCPTIRVFIGIKRPWCLCLNLNCPSKKEKVNREL